MLKTRISQKTKENQNIRIKLSKALRAVRENDISYFEFLQTLKDPEIYCYGDLNSRESRTIILCSDLLDDIFSTEMPIFVIEVRNHELISALLGKIEETVCRNAATDYGGDSMLFGTIPSRID